MVKNKQTPEDDMAAEMLLKDADEALRQDRLQEIWGEWGSTIIGVALMIIFGTMLGVGWTNWRHSVHTHQTAALMNAKPQDISGSYKGIANLMNAGEIAKTQNPAILYELMNEAADSGLPRQWDILAQWGKYRAATDLPNTDLSDIAEKMEKLSKKRKNPYAPAIMMESAILYATADNKDKALSLLNRAKTHPSTSQNDVLKTQIEQLINFYRMDTAS